MTKGNNVANGRKPPVKTMKGKKKEVTNNISNSSEVKTGGSGRIYLRVGEKLGKHGKMKQLTIKECLPYYFRKLSSDLT